MNTATIVRTSFEYEPCRGQARTEWTQPARPASTMFTLAQVLERGHKVRRFRVERETAEVSMVAF